MLSDSSPYVGHCQARRLREITIKLRPSRSLWNVRSHRRDDSNVEELLRNTQSPGDYSKQLYTLVNELTGLTVDDGITRKVIPSLQALLQLD